MLDNRAGPAYIRNMTNANAATDYRTPGVFYGDETRYTGERKILHGGLFFEMELIEGHRKGEKVWTMRKPVTDAELMTTGRRRS
jgi:hypothetical protein